MYLTYSEYEIYGGTISDENVFNDLEFEAEAYIDWYTFNRLQNEEVIPQRVKRCMYHIIKLMQERMELMNGSPLDDTTSSSGGSQIAGMSNDGVSISYNVVSAKDTIDLIKQDIDKLITGHLQGITNSLGRKLLYKGIYPDE